MKTRTTVAHGFVTRPVTRREAFNDSMSSGHRTLPDGFERGFVTIDIDASELVAVLGARALKSKRGLAQLMNGAIRCRVDSSKQRERFPK